MLNMPDGRGPNYGLIMARTRSRSWFEVRREHGELLFWLGRWHGIYTPARWSPDKRGMLNGGGVRHDEIYTLMHVLEEFRKLDPDLPIQYALSFLTLAQNEGMSMRELAERLGIAQSSASRNVAALSKWHSFGKPGLDLVQAEEDPRERRRKIISLTPKGHALIGTLREMMAPRAARAKSA